MNMGERISRVRMFSLLRCVLVRPCSLSSLWRDQSVSGSRFQCYRELHSFGTSH